MAKGDDLEQRLIDFAVAIILLCGAESRRDFIHKLGICSKEMNETQVWLKIIRQSRMLPENEVNPVLKESMNSAAFSMPVFAHPDNVANPLSHLPLTISY